VSSDRLEKADASRHGSNRKPVKHSVRVDCVQDILLTIRQGYSLQQVIFALVCSVSDTPSANVPFHIQISQRPPAHYITFAMFF
jgi:hypothetical protein